MFPTLCRFAPVPLLALALVSVGCKNQPGSAVEQVPPPARMPDTSSQYMDQGTNSGETQDWPSANLEPEPMPNDSGLSNPTSGNGQADSQPSELTIGGNSGGGSSDNTSSGSTPSSPGAGEPGGTYTIQEGDNLWSIAQEVYGSGVRWEDIIAANPGLEANRLTIGEVIDLPR